MPKVALNPPETYLFQYLQHLKRYPHGNFLLRIESKRNRHRTTNGEDWGWFEIAPLGIDTGNYWAGRQRDLTSEEVTDWNRKAEEICKLQYKFVDATLRSEISTLRSEQHHLESNLEELKSNIQKRWDLIEENHNRHKESK